MCHVIRRHLLPEAHGYMYHFVVQTYYCTRLGTCLNGTAEVYFFSLDPTLVSRPEPLNPSWLCLAQPAQPGGESFSGQLRVRTQSRGLCYGAYLSYITFLSLVEEH